MSPEVQAPARVVEVTAPEPLGLSDATAGFKALAAMDSPERWQQLQALRRGQLPVEPLLLQLEAGALGLSADLIAVLMARLDRAGVERVLALAPGADPGLFLEAARQELPSLASDGRVMAAWLEPLLAQPPLLPWLELLGYFRDPRAAERLRQQLQRAIDDPQAWDQASLAPLLPLLGRQRCAEDGERLMAAALAPGPSAWRRAALEGLAVGLSAWPVSLLNAGLRRLATDLDPGLAGSAIDLLARLPEGQRALGQLQRAQLDPAVAARLQRRLMRAPLVLVVHGRQGGVIPEVLQELAAALEQRRGAPVLLQALTAPPPDLDRRWQLAVQRRGRLLLVPLLLLPGDHVCRDVPELAAQWRRQAGAGIAVERRPFLGAWPAWQQLLAQQWQAAAAGRCWRWLHHPLQGRQSERYLRHLAGVLGAPALATPYQAVSELLATTLQAEAMLAPLTLAPNRLSESLRMEPMAASVEVLPPLLHRPAVREFLLASLEALP